MTNNPSSRGRLRPSARFFVLVAVTVGVLLLGSTVLSSWIRWIPAGYVGLIYNAQKGLSKNVIRPRAVLVGPLDQLYLYPTMLRNAVYTEDSQAGEVKAADGILITTSDNANTTFDISVLYRVVPEDVVNIFNTYGPIPIETIQANHIRRAVRDAASEVGSKYDVFQLMGEKRGEASERLTASLAARLKSKGISIVRAMILGAHPSADMTQKINSRVNSYTMLEISRLQSTIAEVNKQTTVTLADAELRAKQLAAARTDSKSIEVLELELMELAIDKWDGRLPKYPNNGSTSLLLGPAGAVPVPQSRQGGQK